MASLPGALCAALGDGVGILGDGGRVTPQNQAMRDLLAVAGGLHGPAADLRALGVDAGADAGWQGGAAVPVTAGGRRWQLRLAREAGVTWLVAREVTGEDRAGSAVAELARLRALAAAAGSVVHDLNNLLNACVGLASHVRPHLHDPIDLRVLQQLTAGTQQGAQLARTVARLLARGPGERVTVPATTIVDEALSVAQKAVSQRGVQLRVTMPEQTPIVRTIVAEAVQSLWHGLLAVVERVPQVVGVELDRVDLAIGGGRPRACARVRCRASGLDRAAAGELAAVVQGAPATLVALARTPLAPGLSVAVFVQRRLGGDLTARADGEELQLDYTWPAAT